MRHSLRTLGRAALLAAIVGVAGCTATVSGEAYGPAYGPGYGPDLVAVSPGVSVIADYDEPIFYTDGFYWRNFGGGWYRSSYYTGGWVYASPPTAILRIDRPYAYRHYRPPGWQGRPARPQPYVAGGGWRGGPAPAPVTRPLTAPPPARAAPPPSQARPRQQQGRAPAPSRGNGWRGSAPPR